MFVVILKRKTTTSQVKFGYFCMSLIRRHHVFVLGALYGLQVYAVANIVIF
jgi:hypothetical protein